MNSYQLYIAASARARSRRWALVLVAPDGELREVSVSEVGQDSATRMELRAAVEGLSLVPRGAEVVVLSDSEGLVRTGAEWLHLWRAQGWRRKRKPLRNVDLLQALAAAVDCHSVSWVKGARAFGPGRRARELCRLPIPSAPSLEELPEPHEPPPPPRVRAAPQRVVAYTDGGCRGNPGGVGGWAFLLLDVRTGAALECAGAEADTTNNRMEITAALAALEALLGQATSVVVRTDSRYLVDLCTQWLPGWKRRGWTRVGGEPIAHEALVRRLDEHMAVHFVHWEWVRGHSGEPGNEWVDRLADEAMDALERGDEPSHHARYERSPVQMDEGELRLAEAPEEREGQHHEHGGDDHEHALGGDDEDAEAHRQGGA